jgi:hypothetical protein
MLWNASALNGLPIKAMDGKTGAVAGLMYDPVNWAIRWLAVDTGEWLSGRRVLLPVAALDQPDPDAHHLPVMLTMKQVADSPDLDEGEPLFLKSEGLFSQHCDLPDGPDHALFGNTVGTPSDVIEAVRLSGATRGSPVRHEGEQDDTQLRSISGCTSNAIEATDGDIGHAEDFLIDTTLWRVRYLVVHTSSWWPGEKLLVSPLSIDWIDWARSIIHLDVDRQKVKDSPPYVAAETVDGAFDDRFQTYYGFRWARR